MQNQLECTWCGSVFIEPKTGVITCPNCGGPKPRQLEEVTYKLVTERYVPVTKPTGSYYRNPQPSRSEWVYDTFGYKLATITIFTIIAAFVVWSLYWLSFRYENISRPNPDNINKYPTTVMVTPTEIKYKDPYEQITWLTNEESTPLPNQQNVINLAQLKNGQALYARDLSAILNETTWQKSKPLGVSDVFFGSDNNTAITIRLNGYWYNINTYQPFVMPELSNLVFIVDKDGQVWMTNYSYEDLVSLEEAKLSLKMIINPNPNLTPTY